LVINYSLLDIKYSDIENKQSIEEEEDNAKLHETASPILNADLSTEQADALRFLNAQIDQIFSENFVNDNNFEMMPAQLYKHSVGLCGRGGVGKTHLLVNLINYWVNDEQKRVCYVANTHNAVNIMKIY
jgi:DNA replication protein DnaC